MSKTEEEVEMEILEELQKMNPDTYFGEPAKQKGEARCRQIAE